MRIKIDGLGMALVLLGILLTMLTFITGCSSTIKTTEIKEEIITVDVPVIHDTLEVAWKGLPDTLIYTWEEFVSQIPDSSNISGTAETIHPDGRKTKVKATYYPKRDTLIIEAEQTPVRVIDKDTTQIFQEKKVPLVEKLGWGVIVLIILGAVVFALTKLVGKK